MDIHLRRLGTSTLHLLTPIDVNADAVDRYVEGRLSDGAANATINRETGLFAQAFRLGVDRQRISAATWRGIHWLAYGSWPVAMAHSLGMGTDASRVWMDGLAGVCTLAVLASVAWRISDHRRNRDRAVELGALTRAVPLRPVARRVAPEPRRASSAPPRRVDSASRILEKERS